MKQPETNQSGAAQHQPGAQPPGTPNQHPGARWPAAQQPQQQGSTPIQEQQPQQSTEQASANPDPVFGIPADSPEPRDGIPADSLGLSADALSFLDAFAETVEPTPEATAPAPPPENCTDFGNARRLVQNHGADVRYCHAWGKWLIWDDRRWKIDESGAIMRKAKETTMSIYQEAGRAVDETERKELAKWALRSEAASRLRAMIELAESEPGIPVSPGELDVDDWLLNTRSGIIDLRTGELRPHTREAMLTKLAPVEYAPDAECPAWTAFLERIMDRNQELISFLQRAVGYALTGDTREEVIFLLYGTGANGKSTFLETMQVLLGDYARQADFSTFLLRQNETVRNDLARLAGVRFVSAVELEPGKRLSESVVKQVTGRDTVTARYLFQEYFEYKPKMKIFLACNHKPIIRGNDHAIWRRIRLIPFNVRIPDAEQDKDLDRKLRAELPGILAWAVRGCLEWQKQGLGKPEAVKDATDEYRGEMDVLGGFFEDRCVIGDGLRAVSSELYKEYLGWAQDSGIRKPMSQTMFSLRLAERGLAKKRITGGKVAWLGVGIRSDEDELRESVYARDEYSDKYYRHQLEDGVDENGWEGSL